MFHNVELLRQSLTWYVVCILTVSVPACVRVYSHVSTVWYNSGVRGQVPRRSLQTSGQRPQDQDVRLRKRIPGTGCYSHLSVIACISLVWLCFIVSHIDVYVTPDAGGAVLYYYVFQEYFFTCNQLVLCFIN